MVELCIDCGLFSLVNWSEDNIGGLPCSVKDEIANNVQNLDRGMGSVLLGVQDLLAP
jgi:hypothetical protein